LLTQIPVVDLFAGPGGLGEGFSSYSREGTRFRLAVSIEKDKFAHRTLLLRSFFRQFEKDEVPEDYYRYVRGELESLEELLELHPSQASLARREARCIELGASPENNDLVDRIIGRAMGDRDHWVLIGGPPCQAYSVMGRSRRINTDPEGFRSDSRHRLYEHYLRILARHGPAIFVMENVKGLLSSRLDGELLLDRLLLDFEQPCSRVDRGALTDAPNPPKCGYHLYSLGVDATSDAVKPGDLVVRSEEHGIPQTRHRLFIFGVRADLPHLPPRPLRKVDAVSTAAVIEDLPPLRSRLSREPDSSEAWVAAIRDEFEKLEEADLPDDHRAALARAVDGVGSHFSTGGRFMSSNSEPVMHRDWFMDSRLGGVLNHETRSHRRDDLLRYLYLSSVARRTGQRVKLRDLPKELLPAHKSAAKAVRQGYGTFADRFRVQVADEPATTVASHISKDGHYYIHSDPSQCRSLTVREAARIQTFPDNYFFEGPRTQQYLQVGNAVPPLLARQIAEIAHDVLMQPRDSGLVRGLDEVTSGGQQMSLG
jgi:DNA (cytosine-5)-methyltransferase 1